jgi:hypothetical protein
VIDHPPHVENARRSLAAFDAARTGAELGQLGVRVASAMRVLLYEPADEYQGWYIETPTVADAAVAQRSEQSPGIYP